MTHQVMGNRILPQNWGEVRDLKGIKFHKKCWWAVAAFFGFAIKWKKIYFVTESAKNWWKANSRWREEHGFRGEFSKQKFLKLLNTKIQARTTIPAIQKAAAKLPLVYKGPVALQATITPTKPLTDPEQIIKVCEECKQLIAQHKDVVWDNDNEMNEALHALELHVESFKAWLEFQDTPEFRKFMTTIPSLKSKIETKIFKLREEEIKRLPTHTEIAADVTLPMYPQFDVKTAKLMQQRWFIKIKAPELHSKSVRQATLDEAIVKAPNDEVKEGLEKLKVWMAQNPEVPKIDVENVRTTITEKIKFLLQFRKQYEAYFTETFNLQFTESLQALMNIKDAPNVHHDPDLGGCLFEIGSYLPAECENIELQAYLSKFLFDNTFPILVQSLLEESLVFPESSNHLQADVLFKLKACVDAIHAEDPKAIHDELQKHFPNRFQLQALDALQQKLEWAKELKQLVDEIVASTREEVRQRAVACGAKFRAQQPFRFNRATFLETFPKVLEEYDQLVKESQQLTNNYFLPEELLDGLEIPHSYRNYTNLYHAIAKAKPIKVETQAIDNFVQEVEKFLAYAPKQLGDLKAILLDIPKKPLGETVKSLKEFRGATLCEDRAIAIGFHPNSPEGQFAEEYEDILGMNDFYGKMQQLGQIQRWIDEVIGYHYVAFTEEIHQSIQQYTDHLAQDIEGKLKDCYKALCLTEGLKGIFEVLHKHFPNQFDKYPDVEKSTLCQKMEWAKTFKQVVDDTVASTREDMRKRAEICREKCRTHQPFVFNRATFLDTFPQALEDHVNLQVEIQVLHQFDRDLKLPEDLIQSYSNYERLYQSIQTTKISIEDLKAKFRPPLLRLLTNLDGLLQYAPEPLGKLKEKLLDVQKFVNGIMSLEDTAKSLAQYRGAFTYADGNIAKAFGENSPERQFAAPYNDICNMQNFLTKMVEQGKNSAWIASLIIQHNSKIASEITQAIRQSDSKDKEKLEAMLLQVNSGKPRELIHKTLEEYYPGKFSAPQKTIEGFDLFISRTIQIQEWLNTLSKLGLHETTTTI